MILVVGLGNPGSEYAATRHNIGFHVVDELARRWALGDWKTKYTAKINEYRASGPVLLMKPQTYMNLSGVSVAEAARFYKVPTPDIIVIHDDLDLPAGQLRLRERGGSGGHKGIESMFVHLGTAEFIRVRFGIGRPPEGWDTPDFVLSRFRPEEAQVITEAVKRSADAVEAIMKEGIAKAMNTFNR